MEEKTNKETSTTLDEVFGNLNNEDAILEFESSDQQDDDDDEVDVNNENANHDCSIPPGSVFEPFEQEDDKEGETWGLNEGYCTSPIYTGLA